MKYRFQYLQKLIKILARFFFDVLYLIVFKNGYFDKLPRIVSGIFKDTVSLVSTLFSVLKVNIAFVV